MVYNWWWDLLPYIGWDLWVSSTLLVLSLTRQEFQRDSFLENVIFGWASIFELFTVKGMTVRKPLFFIWRLKVAYQMCRSGRPDRPISEWNESIVHLWTAELLWPQTALTSAALIRWICGLRDPLRIACLSEKDAPAIVNGRELLLTMLLWHGLY